MRYLIFILITGSLFGCSSQNRNEVIYHNTSLDTLLGKNRTSIEKSIGINLDEVYGYYYDGSTYTGNRYRYYTFIFKNNSLVHIADLRSIQTIWTNAFKVENNIIPYTNEIPTIHNKISSLPLFNPKPSKQNKTTPQNGDAIAAGAMTILAIPIMPLIMSEKLTSKDIHVNWEKDVIARPTSHLTSKLGQPIEHHKFTKDDILLGYKQRYFWVPHYVGSRDGAVMWVLHRSHIINKHLGRQ